MTVNRGKVIAICGGASTGKREAADEFVRRGWRCIDLSRPIKEAVCIGHGLKYEDWDDLIRNRSGPIEKSPRREAQEIGETINSSNKPSVATYAANLAWTMSCNGLDVVISGVKTSDEASALITEVGAKVYETTKLGAPSGAGNHHSELPVSRELISGYIDTTNLNTISCAVDTITYILRRRG